MANPDFDWDRLIAALLDGQSSTGQSRRGLGQGLFGQSAPPGTDATSLWTGLLSQPQGLFGSGLATGLNALAQERNGLAQGLDPFARSTTAPLIRHVFYSFHYADVFRVNHVRNAGKIRTGDRGRFLVPEDRSLWEQAKRTGEDGLRRIIDQGMRGTSVTCVLAGADTWQREWVRYEIARSLVCRNGLLTVHIHNCRCPRVGFGATGPNPLAYMALGSDRRIYERIGTRWFPYPKVARPLDQWPAWLPRPSDGYVMPLDVGTGQYDWIGDDGCRNLLQWTDTASRAARG